MVNVQQQRKLGNGRVGLWKLWKTCPVLATHCLQSALLATCCLHTHCNHIASNTQLARPAPGTCLERRLAHPDKLRVTNAHCTGVVPPAGNGPHGTNSLATPALLLDHHLEGTLQRHGFGLHAYYSWMNDTALRAYYTCTTQLRTVAYLSHRSACTTAYKDCSVILSACPPTIHMQHQAIQRYYMRPYHQAMQRYYV